MLELRNIVKDYYVGENEVHALRGVSLSFRPSEFVSILGPSGCGKTTLLNIIGGLDRYTSGDLIINGRSTKDFKDGDWDTYRNHSIGFVFQSYNLIPHQTVLSNVELALTLSGVSKQERRQRAIEALELVGLGDQLSKKPNQMSGGQMQRVAIARALVNDPDILLADEPTGALDSVTSVQIMDILKKVSEKRLVIMVTHNPEIAEEYSTRIVRLRDGEIVSDSAPFEAPSAAPQVTFDPKVPIKKDKKSAKKDKKSKNNNKERKSSMSFFTALTLSFNNLMTKRARTVLTSFAGSIGIIGIALILAVSQGTSAYIDAVQEKTLSSYPITLEKTTVDISSLMQAFMNVNAEEVDHEKDAVYKRAALYNMLNAMNSIEQEKNDLASFKKYIEKELKDKKSDLYKAVNGVQYSYDLDLLVYTKNVDGDIIRSDTEEILLDLMLKYIGVDMSAMSSMSSMSPMMSMSPSAGLWQEMLPANDGGLINDLIYDQYELVDGGSWPSRYNEIVLVLDENNELDDITLYALGLLPESEIDKLADAALNGTIIEPSDTKWSYDDIKSREYKVILNSKCYKYNEELGYSVDLRSNPNTLAGLYNEALSLKVTGIIRPKEEAKNSMLKGSICYTSALTEYVITESKKSPLIDAQLANPGRDMISGLPFKSTTGDLTPAEKKIVLLAYYDALKDDDSLKAMLYPKFKSVMPVEEFNLALSAALSGVTPEQMREHLALGLSQGLGLSKEELAEYFDSMSEQDLKALYSQMLAKQIKESYAQKALASIPTDPLLLKQEMDEFFAGLGDASEEQCALYYDDVMTFSSSTYENNLIALGYIDLESPSKINIYASSFENKDLITAAIDDYNKDVDDLQKIKFTDYIGIIMSSITTILNAITYVLISFVSISLIVSSIMIGVITLISVQERTKEIGILRAIGASKRNISSMFNAETMIIGFTSGLLGVIVTYLICIPVNIILHLATGIENLRAILPWEAALLLIAISVLLTLFAGIIPSRSAAKKDPVVALRTE